MTRTVVQAFIQCVKKIQSSLARDNRYFDLQLLHSKLIDLVGVSTASGGAAAGGAAGEGGASAGAAEAGGEGGEEKTKCLCCTKYCKCCPRPVRNKTLRLKKTDCWNCRSTSA